jgi:hypothetical protein
MDQQGASWTPAQAQALEYAWGEYHVWAETARHQRAEIFIWRLRVLVLTVLGALMGTVSSELSGILTTASWIAGILGGSLIALATYLGREILKPDQERLWVRARSMAEALKAETFLFRSGAPPYDASESGPKLLEQVKALLAKVKDMQSAILPQDERLKGLPEGPLSVGLYIEERVNDQIYNFYAPRAQQFVLRLKRWRITTLALGGVAAILGVCGKWTGALVAVITTVITSVVAYIYANRYQYLIISYQATARQLEFLKHQWAVMGAPESDPEKRSRFILECERVISIENNAWMAKWTEKPAG